MSDSPFAPPSFRTQPKSVARDEFGLEQLPDGAQLRARAEEAIRAHPLVSIVIGALAGFLLGRVLRD